MNEQGFVILQLPLVNFAIYLLIFGMLIYSWIKYKQGGKHFLYIFNGFLLILLARIIQHFIAIYHVRPRTVEGVILHGVAILLAIIAAILIFYVATKVKRRQVK